MGAYSDRVIADGASNYWRLGEASGLSAVDSVGGKHGTISGGVTLNQAGAIGDGSKAMVFDGATGKIVTAAAIAMTTTVTVEAWMKTTAVVTQSFWSNRQAGGVPASAVRFGVVAAGQVFVQSDALGQGTGAKAVNDGLWHHVVWTQNGPTVILYVDGGVDYTTPAPFAGNTLPVSIGVELQGPSYFNGAIDDLAMYPRVLTPAEVNAHYTLGITPDVVVRTTNDLNTGLAAFLPGTGDLTTEITAYLATLTGEATARWKQMEKNAGF